MMSIVVWLPGSIFLLERSLSLVPSGGEGLCPEGVSVQRGLCLGGGRETSPRIRKAGGTRPTGMLSCLM